MQRWISSPLQHSILCCLRLRRGAQTGVEETLQQAQQKLLKEYTEEEVAKHCSKEDVWIVVKGKVYDVSGYVEEHPGGDAILKNAGKDATEGFHGPQHPPRVFDIIDDFLIGKLIDS